MSRDLGRAARDVFDETEVREVLRSTFYVREIPLAKALPEEPLEPRESAPAPRPKRRASKPKPDHYEIICISLYKEDLARLDEKVAKLKERGHRRATRSALIRWALDQIDLDAVPRGL